jgi:hypothetical protein
MLLQLVLLCTNAQALNFAARHPPERHMRRGVDEENQAAMLVGGVASGLAYSASGLAYIKMRTCFSHLDCIETVRPLFGVTQQCSIALAVGALALRWAMHESEIVPMIFGPAVPPVPRKSRFARRSAAKPISKRRI